MCVCVSILVVWKQVWIACAFWPCITHVWFVLFSIFNFYIIIERVARKPHRWPLFLWATEILHLLLVYICSLFLLIFDYFYFFCSFTNKIHCTFGGQFMKVPMLEWSRAHRIDMSKQMRMRYKLTYSPRKSHESTTIFTHRSNISSITVQIAVHTLDTRLSHAYSSDTCDARPSGRAHRTVPNTNRWERWSTYQAGTVWSTTATCMCRPPLWRLSWRASVHVHKHCAHWSPHSHGNEDTARARAVHCSWFDCIHRCFRRQLCVWLLWRNSLTWKPCWCCVVIGNL
jgi:hypothetical protein